MKLIFPENTIHEANDELHKINFVNKILYTDIMFIKLKWKDTSNKIEEVSRAVFSIPKITLDVC